MALNLGELLVQLGFDGSEFDKNMAKAMQQLTDFGQKLGSGTNVPKLKVDVSGFSENMAKATNATAGMQKHLEGFTQTASGLLVPVGTLSDKLENVADVSGKTGDALKKTSDEARRTGENLSKMGGHAHGARPKVEGLVGTLTDMNTQMGLMMGGATLSAAITAPFVLMGKAALDASVRFESAFAGVRKTVTATESEFEQIENRFRSMAQTTPITAEQFARIGELAGQLGVRGVEDLTEFTDVVAKLGVTTDLSTEEAATSLARFANIMQMPLKNASRLGATIVDLGNNLATTEPEITQFALRIAGAGKQVGLSESQVLGFGAALSSVGIEAEAGGTAISRVFAKLATVTAKGGDDLELFAQVANTSAAAFAKAFQDDAASATIAFITGLKRLQDQGVNVFGVLEKLELQDIRVRDALLRTAGAGDLLTRSIGLASDAWSKNTALNEEAGKRFATTESSIQVLKNSFDELVRKFGDAVSPALNGLIRSLGTVVSILQDTPMPIQMAIAGFAGLLAVIGPLMLGVAGLGAVISGVKVALPVLSTVLAGLTSGIGLAVTAAATLVVVIGALAISQKRAQVETEKSNQALVKLSGRYEELRSVVDDTTTSEMERSEAASELKTLSKQIGDMFPNLISKWDDHGNAVELDTTKLRENTKAAKDNAKAKADAMVLEAREKVGRLNDEIERLQKQQTQFTGSTNFLGMAAARGFKADEVTRNYESQIAQVRQSLEGALKELGTALRNAGGDAIVGSTDELRLEQRMRRQAERAADAVMETAEKVTSTVTEETAKQVTAIDILGHRLERLDSQWQTYSTRVGDAAKDANYLTTQKQYLTDRLGLLFTKLGELDTQYQVSLTKTGEFSEETRNLASAMDSTNHEIARAQTELVEFSAPIVQAKDNLNAAGKAAEGMKAWIVTLSDRLETAQEKLDRTSQAVKDLESEIKDAEGGISEALGTMATRAGEVEKELNAAKSAMRELGNVRFQGEGALGQQLDDLRNQEAKIRLQINQMLQQGVDKKDTRITDLETQLEKMGLRREELQLTAQVEFEPLRQELKRLTDDSKELTFDEAKTQLADYQTKVGELTTKHMEMTSQMEGLRKSVEPLVPKINDANTSFETAALKVTELRDKLMVFKDQLNNELLPAQTAQKDLVGEGNRYLKDFNSELQTLVGKQNAAASALENLRSAAASAASAMGVSAAPLPGPAHTPGEVDQLVKEGKLGDAAGILSNLFGISVEDALKTIKSNLNVNIPQFAKGALVDSPTLGIFGEKGPEVVAPLPKIGELLSAFGSNVMARATAGFRAMSPEGALALDGMGGISVSVRIGERELEDIWVEMKTRAERRGRA